MEGAASRRQDATIQAIIPTKKKTGRPACDEAWVGRCYSSANSSASDVIDRDTRLFAKQTPHERTPSSSTKTLTRTCPDVYHAKLK